MKRNVLWILAILLVMITPLVSAEIDLHDSTLTADEENALDEMLAPLMTIINGLRYASGAVFLLVAIIAGIMLMAGASKPETKDKAKNTLVFAVIGLAIIIMAPWIVDFIF